MKLPDPPVGTAALRYEVNRAIVVSQELATQFVRRVSGLRRLLTCVVHVGPSVEGGCAAGLNLPPGAGVLGRPAAEGRVVGQTKVAGKPKESCKKKCTKATKEGQERETLGRFHIPAASEPGRLIPPLVVIRLEHQRAPESLCSVGINKREPRRGIQGGGKKPGMSQRCRPHVIFFNESKRGH